MKTRSRTDWDVVIAAVRRQDTVSSAEVARLAKQHTDVAADYTLRYLRRKGVLRRLNAGPRGLYVVVRGTGGAFVSDPIEAVQAAHGVNVVFGYGTALFLHGLSRYARLSEYYAVARSKRKPRPIGKFVLRFVKTPLLNEIGVTTKRHGRGSVRVTDLERTLIDSIHRPKYAQGWENVVHALSRAQGVNGSRMIEYVKQYRTPSLAAKVGLIIEHYTTRWGVSGRSLDSLRPYLPKTPVTFSRGSGGPLNKDWNIYVPEGLLHE